MSTVLQLRKRRDCFLVLLINLETDQQLSSGKVAVVVFTLDSNAILIIHEIELAFLTMTFLGYFQFS